MNRDILSNITEVSFIDLLKICKNHFGFPLIIGCHYVFETPWDDDPVISIQKDGEIARPYQVRIVKEAIEKLETRSEKH